MLTRGVRGATTVETNTRDAILAATRELLAAMLKANEFEVQDVAYAFFPTTQDTHAEFPAPAASNDRPILAPRAIPHSREGAFTMIVVMKTDATEAQVINVQKQIRELGFKDHLIRGVERSVVAVLGQVYPELVDELAVIDGVGTV